MFCSSACCPLDYTEAILDRPIPTVLTCSWLILMHVPTFHLTRLFVSPDFSSHQTFRLTRLFVLPDFLSYQTFCSEPQDTHSHVLWRGWQWLQQLQAVSGQQGCSIKLPLPSQQDKANDWGFLPLHLQWTCVMELTHHGLLTTKQEWGHIFSPALKMARWSSFHL